MATILQHGTAGQRFGITDTSLSASTSGQELAPTQITELVLERKHIRRLQQLQRVQWVHDCKRSLLLGCIVLKGQLLSRAFQDPNLSLLPNLRRASFADNQISHIESLEGCTALEELCLEENRVVAIEGLQGCTRIAWMIERPREVHLTKVSTCTPAAGSGQPSHEQK
eukprot:791699-Pelagomonas_calceolata.AAC.7